MPEPSTNGTNGRDNRGRFTKGHPGGPGNPNVRKVSKLRKAMLSAVKAEDIIVIVKKLVADAKAGDRHARAELLDRVVGRADGYAALVQVFENQERLDRILEVLNERQIAPHRAVY